MYRSASSLRYKVSGPDPLTAGPNLSLTACRGSVPHQTERRRANWAEGVRASEGSDGGRVSGYMGYSPCKEGDEHEGSY